LTQTYHHTYGLPVVILRCGNIYGGGDLNWSRIIPYTIRCFLNNERPVIRSDGKFVRDYVYVKDVSRCYLRAAECLQETSVAGQAFNFSLEQPATVLEIVAALQELMQCQHLQPEVLNHAPGEIREQYLNTDKAQRILKWQAEYPLKEGLQETIAWYRNFLATHQQP
jgi:CDP-glucose 4,6-dehydratase